MFRLNKQDCKLTSVNPRSEFHGEEHQLGCDLKFKTTMPNTVLDLFDEELRQLLFMRPRAEDMDMVDQARDGEDYLTARRFPEIGTVGWDYKGAGYRMVLQSGITGSEEVILINTEIDNFKFSCLDGGSVELEFRVKGHPNETDMGKLCTHLQSDVDLTLEPPSAERLAQMEMEGDDEEDDEAA